MTFGATMKHRVGARFGAIEEKGEEKDVGWRLKEVAVRASSQGVAALATRGRCEAF
jgi:Arc/MetJ family transcription regulator